MLLSAFTPADLPRLAPLQPEGWVDITPHFQFYLDMPFCHPIKVTVGDEILGLGNRMVFGNTAWLLMIITHPAYRRRGIGAYVTQALVDACKADGCRTVMLIASALGEPVYRKLGFESEGIYHFYKGGTVPLTELPDIVPYQEEYQEELLALAARASGEDRAPLLRLHLHSALMHLSEGQFDGFYLPTLGEGYIVADNEAAGTALMAYKYARPHFHAAMPEANRAGHAFLQAHGYTLSGQMLRMRLGEAVQWQPEMLFGRIGGAA